jgi:putative ABC transport system ATP-binding protein
VPRPSTALSPSTSSATAAPSASVESAAAVGSLIELRGVSRVYQLDGLGVTALSEVDLTVRAGEFVVVLGPSGSGKTTLLNLIGGLDAASGGSVRVAGRAVTGASRGALAEYRRHTTSFIFQTFNLFPGLTALENVEFGAEAAGRNDAAAIAQQRLAEVGLDERINHFPHQLSGGEQQRVAIARALATGNPVVLADEPTGELDFRTGVQILELLRSQATPERAVLVVTHNREIARVADRVVELSSGRIISDGAPAGGRADVADLRW